MKILLIWGKPFMPLIAPAPILSERLLLRLITESDLPALLELNSSDEVTALLPYNLRSARVLQKLGFARGGWRRRRNGATVRR
jgi:RimJ/RimL family protein N-acetyltransferase